MLRQVRAFGHIQAVAIHLDLGVLGYATQEEDYSKQQAELDSDGQIKDYRQEECHKQHGDVAAMGVEYGHQRAPAAHIVCHYYQHCCQTGHRDMVDKRHGKQEYKQQYGGVYDSGHGRTSAVADIGHSAGYGACDGDAAEERHYHIGRALTDKLGIGIGMAAGDAVGHGGGQQ